MNQVYRPTLIKFGERTESPRSLVWEDGAESIDKFAIDSGFPDLLYAWNNETHAYKNLSYSAHVYSALPGIYPRYLLTIDPFKEFHCVLCWDLSDLFEAMTLFGLRTHL